MATSLSPATDLISLKCSICLELFSDPRVLPCLHTYCLKCLQGLVSDQKSDLNCPQCRAKHEIPKGDVANFLCDLSILPELEAAKADMRKKEETKICGLCTSGEVAVGYCQDCGEYLCKCCQDIVHKKVKLFGTHKITSVEESTSSPIVIHTAIQPAVCPCHPKYELEIFCKSCDRVVCSMCMLESTHKGHSYDFFRNVQDELMERIKSMTEDIEDKEMIFNNSLAFFEKFEKQLCRQRDKIETEINTAYDEYIKIAQASKQQLLKQVEFNFTKDSKTIWATKNHLGVVISQVKSCQAFSERYQKQGSEGQMLSLMNQLLHRLTKLKSIVVDLSGIKSITTPRIEFIRTRRKLASLGTLSITGNIVLLTDLEESSVQKFIAKLRERTKYVYFLNEPLMQTEKWECTYSRNNSLTLSSRPVVVSSNNRLEVEFTPTVPGKYSFKLTSNLSPKSVVQFNVNVDHVNVCDLVGARVKRGPDWCYGDYDGGDGKLGTMRLPSSADIEFDCVVSWDNNASYCHRWGSDGKYELELVPFYNSYLKL